MRHLEHVTSRRKVHFDKNSRKELSIEIGICVVLPILFMVLRMFNSPFPLSLLVKTVVQTTQSKDIGLIYMKRLAVSQHFIPQFPPLSSSIYRLCCSPLFHWYTEVRQKSVPEEYITNSLVSFDLSPPNSAPSQSHESIPQFHRE